MNRHKGTEAHRHRVRKTDFLNPELCAFVTLCLCYFPICLCACLLISGCGYTIRSGIKSGIKTINIATFKNKTFEHGLEVALSKLLTREFILDGTLSVTGFSRADSKLSGELVEYILEPYTYGADEADVEQYKIRVCANVSLTDTTTGEIIWEEKLMEGDAAYYLTGSLARTEEEALELALYELVKKIVSRTVRAW